MTELDDALMPYLAAVHAASEKRRIAVAPAEQIIKAAGMEYRKATAQALKRYRKIKWELVKP